MMDDARRRAEAIINGVCSGPVCTCADQIMSLVADAVAQAIKEAVTPIERITENAKAEAAIIAWKAGTLTGDVKMLIDQIVAQAVRERDQEIAVLQLIIEDRDEKIARLRRELRGDH